MSLGEISLATKKKLFANLIMAKTALHITTDCHQMSNDNIYEEIGNGPEVKDVNGNVMGRAGKGQFELQAEMVFKDPEFLSCNFKPGDLLNFKEIGKGKVNGEKVWKKWKNFRRDMLRDCMPLLSKFMPNGYIPSGKMIDDIIKEVLGELERRRRISNAMAVSKKVRKGRKKPLE